MNSQEKAHFIEFFRFDSDLQIAFLATCALLLFVAVEFSSSLSARRLGRKKNQWNFFANAAKFNCKEWIIFSLLFGAGLGFLILALMQG